MLLRSTLIFMLSCFILLSCQDDNTDIDLRSSAWVVHRLKQESSFIHSWPKDNYLLEFTSDSTFALNLDVNDCGGIYSITQPGEIEISTLSCTEACCDSDFAEELIELLPRMTSYHEKGNRLIFQGEGEVVLKSL